MCVLTQSCGYDAETICDDGVKSSNARDDLANYAMPRPDPKIAIGQREIDAKNFFNQILAE